MTGQPTRKSLHFYRQHCPRKEGQTAHIMMSGSTVTNANPDMYDIEVYMFEPAVTSMLKATSHPSVTHQNTSPSNECMTSKE